MTTDTRFTRPTSAGGVLSRTLPVAGLLALVLTGAGFLFDQAPGGLGALTGAAVVLVVFALGTFFTNVVATIMPAMSLLIAMMTFLLQFAVVLVVMVALDRSSAVDDTLSRGWIAGSVIAMALMWTWVQLWFTLRARTLAYQLPEAGAK